MHISHQDSFKSPSLLIVIFYDYVVHWNIICQFVQLQWLIKFLHCIIVALLAYKLSFIIPNGSIQRVETVLAIYTLCHQQNIYTASVILIDQMQVNTANVFEHKCETESFVVRRPANMVLFNIIIYYVKFK